MRTLKLLTSAFAFGVTLTLSGQDMQDVAHMSVPPTTSWPTYHGDYSGKHFSTLSQINSGNVKGLTLAWMYHPSVGTQGAIVGGAATAAPPRAGGPPGAIPGAPQIKSIPLMVDGVLYLSTTNNVYAVDARSGREIWHYIWQGRTAIGNRGLAISKGLLYFETGNNNFVALDAATGKERWHKALAEDTATNFSTSAPVVIRDHVIVGVGGDSGTNSTWVESRDTTTGDLQWRWDVTPKAGDPGIETWPNAAASAIGAGGPWQPGTYDPELNLLYIPTGNPTPTWNGRSREGKNLYTCSLVALNPDTGKVAWYYQYSPHDTHDWDSTQVPVLIDGTIDGKPRKVVALANRNGYYFVLDRATGKSLVVKKFIESANAYKTELDSRGELVPDKDKEPSPGGTLVAPDSDGASNYPPPTYDPETGLFYINATYSYSIYYLNVDATDPTGYGRGGEYHTGMFESSLRALDFKTGVVKWEHKYPELGFWSSTYPGMLSTAGGLLFTGNPSHDFVAFEAKTGKILWHADLGAIVSNGPETFLLDGKQYVVTSAGGAMYAFYLQ